MGLMNQFAYSDRILFFVFLAMVKATGCNIEQDFFIG